MAGKELPDALLDGIPADGSVDIGYAWRDFADGRRWWVLGWCVRRVTLDPLPSQVTPGRGVGVRVEGGEHPRLFVVAPSGHWQELRLVAKDTRWVDGLDERGDYRFEVVDGDRVELLWGIHVGEGVPPLAPLGVARPLENPVTAVEALYAKVDALRRTNGLRSLARFSTFEPIVREQAACLALGGVAAHDTEHCPGVPGRATQRFYPRGHFHEDVAVGDTTEEAWQTLLASPGHLANLLCVDCTHLSIGAAVEPVTEPRLFVVWEAMEFPNGEPRVIGDR